jgi:hypothetical protein
MGLFCRTLAAAALVAACWHPALAQQDQGQHCPQTEANDTYSFLSGAASDSEDRANLAKLADTIAKSGRPVCVLAFVDPQDANHSKMMAFRRAVWVRDTLVGKGVDRGKISMELRPLGPEDDRANLRNVSVLLGR